MSTPLVEQKPFNGHAPGEVFVSDDAIVAREAPDDGGDIITSAPAGYEDSMKRWQDNAAFIVHCWNTYCQREAELQSMRERLSRMEEALKHSRGILESVASHCIDERYPRVARPCVEHIDAALSNK